MTNSLVVYEKVENPLREATTKESREMVSSFCGVPLAQAPAVLLTCMVEGISLQEYARTFHNIQGKNVMKAAAMIANFRTKFGGDHEILANDSTKAGVKLILKGRDHTHHVTAEEMMQSRIPWNDWQEGHKALASLPVDMPFDEKFAQLKAMTTNDNKPLFKDNWATPTDWRKMLWWRCVSEAVDVFCPEVDSGAQSIEEEGFASPMRYVEAATAATAAPAEAPKSAMDRIKSASEAPAPSEVTSATVTTNAPPAEPTPQAEPQEPPQEPGFASSAQIDRLRGLFEQLGIGLEDQNAIYSRRNATTAHGLRSEEIEEIIAKLEEKAKALSPSS